MSPRLETNADRQLEQATMDRLLAGSTHGATAVQLPELSAVDYVTMRDGKITTAVEIKTRKETVEQIRGYGGLMLKHRKLLELQTIGTLLRVPVVVAFAFENDTGPIYLAYPERLNGHEPQQPPRRRNYRGLACDEEPVIYLDWDKDLWRAL